MVLDEYEDPNHTIKEALEQVTPSLKHEEAFRKYGNQSPQRFRRRENSPGAQELIINLSNGNFIISHDPDNYQVESPTATEHSSAMTEQPDGETVQPALDGESARIDGITHRPRTVINTNVENERNELAIVSTNESTASDASQDAKSARLRVDSALSEVHRPFAEKGCIVKQEGRSGRGAGLGHEDMVCEPTGAEDEQHISPALRKNAIPATPNRIDTLPAIQTSPSTYQEGGSTSPQSSKLPPYQHLSKLADAAVNEAARAQHVQRQSVSSATAQSPSVIQYGQYSGAIATSPTGTYPPSSALSPIATSSTLSQQYGSPQSQYGPTLPYYSDRRASNVTDRYPNQPPSMMSSSGESQCAGSSSEGYSTSHTTPTDMPAPNDANPRILPASANMPASLVPGPFQCDYPNCKAMAFATQYLLNSHKTVHSQVRSHYCPVPDCSRGVGGQGFKRKNEMIRHGLVHDSPGYVCPFCPEREHKYPRPDNLQRHVRVHHVDKSKDDQILQQVLSQRGEGSMKQRRRRTTGSSRG